MAMETAGGAGDSSVTADSARSTSVVGDCAREDSVKVDSVSEESNASSKVLWRNPGTHGHEIKIV